MTETSPFTVTQIHAETDQIKRFTLSRNDGAAVAWQAGAHVRVALANGGDRAYSLMRLPGLEPHQIALGVLREVDSTGGSTFMHALEEGQELSVTAPANHFALHDDPAPALLIAGGIGITPLLSMAAELSSRNHPYSLHYAGRSARSLAFVDTLKALCGDRLHLHYDDDETALSIDTVLKTAAEGAHLYVCGPSGMIDAVLNQAKAQGWPETRLHSERFTADAPAGADTAFDVEIASSGQIIHVPADQSIIEALEAAGLDPLYDCQRGDCGICQCDVIDGIPDHRDVILTDAEKAAGDVMQICVSRAKSAKLTLDI